MIPPHLSAFIDDDHLANLGTLKQYPKVDQGYDVVSLTPIALGFHICQYFT